ncbi:hypothetical protein BDZ85DRAFT_122496 [Elsinoe ampelina]|uniref:Uncharacterized protein n=1 Tax=Elsinoe ampelina TaxID=302913 RepID=A0A6A6GBR5_9PEZI|nr:hypothetical protein BDZ85DRAFT_122496 [Elsinoe ampelina]
MDGCISTDAVEVRSCSCCCACPVASPSCVMRQSVVGRDHSALLPRRTSAGVLSFVFMVVMLSLSCQPVPRASLTRALPGRGSNSSEL